VNGKLSTFATFLNVATAKLSGNVSVEFTQTWKAAVLDTHFIELGEDATYARESVAMAAVQDWLKKNKILGKTAGFALKPCIPYFEYQCSVRYFVVVVLIPIVIFCV
jgi:hypothetical protein